MARRPLPAALATLVIVVVGSAVPAPSAAQQPMAMVTDSAWGMLPMDAAMPVLPGLEGAAPTVGPYRPGTGVDVSALPEARPSETVGLADGDTLELPVTLVRRNIDGHDVVMFGYDGQHPGPLLRAPRGATFSVRVTNEIRLPTTVHWHGVRLENRFDGVPGLTQDAIEPGESFTYDVRVPDAGMFWYHPHAREDVQLDLGLFGNLLVTSPDPDHYGPAHREELLVLDDLLLAEHGPFPWGARAATHALMGRYGNTMLVNGRTDQRFQVRAGEVVRFFLTNVANSRTFNVTFGGAPVKLVASDIGRFEREQWVESVVIGPAERYTVEVRFDEPGTVAIANTIQAVNHFRGEFYPRVDTLALVSVATEAAEADIGTAFESLRALADVGAEMDALRAAHLDRSPDYELSTTVRVQGLHPSIVLSMEADTLYVPPMEWNDAMPMMNWLSSSEQVTWILRDAATGAENGDIDWRFRVGDLVKLRIFNDPGSFHPMNHPMHVHGQRFLVLAVDGVESRNMAWKDTAIVPVGSTVDLLVEMSNPGTWMLHCHIAEHLQAGMMFPFLVDDGAP